MSQNQKAALAARTQTRLNDGNGTPAGSNEVLGGAAAIADSKNIASDIEDTISDAKKIISNVKNGATDVSEGASDMKNGASDVKNGTSDVKKIAFDVKETVSHSHFAAFRNAGMAVFPATYATLTVKQANGGLSAVSQRAASICHAEIVEASPSTSLISASLRP